MKIVGASQNQALYIIQLTNHLVKKGLPVAPILPPAQVVTLKKKKNFD
jgi:hypothetical protein